MSKQKITDTIEYNDSISTFQRLFTNYNQGNVSNSTRSPRNHPTEVFNDSVAARGYSQSTLASASDPSIFSANTAEAKYSTNGVAKFTEFISNAKKALQGSASDPVFESELNDVVISTNTFSGTLVAPSLFNYTQSSGTLVESERNTFTGSISETEYTPKTFEDLSLASHIFATDTGNTYEEREGEDWVQKWIGSSNEAALLQLVDDSIANTYTLNNGNVVLQRTGVLDLTLGDRPLEEAYIKEASKFASTVDHLFGTNLGEKNAELLKSQSISYEHFLTELDNRVDTTDNSQSFGDFIGEIFSKDTLTEIGATFTDAAAEVGMQLLQSLIPTIRMPNGSSDTPEGYVGYVLSDTVNGKDFKKFRQDWTNKVSYFTPVGSSLAAAVLPNGLADFSDKAEVKAASTGLTKEQADNINELRIAATTTNIAREDEGGASTKKVIDGFVLKYEKEQPFYWNNFATKELIARSIESKMLTLLSIISGSTGVTHKQTPDRSDLFEKFISKNPFLGQHQFILSIKQPTGSGVSYTLPEVYDEMLFRLSNISIPAYQRQVAKTQYGHSALTLISNLQASSDHKAVISIYCDRNLDVLEYLTRLTGTCVCEEGKPETGEKVVYNLSTVADDSYKEGVKSATIKVLNGRDINKMFFAEDREIQLHKDPASFKTLSFVPDDNGYVNPERGLIEYAKHIFFEFENFKIVNLDYPLKFDSTKTDANLLEIKATVTWTKLNTNWIDDEDEYYEQAEDVTKEDIPEDLYGKILKAKLEKANSEQEQQAIDIANANGLDPINDFGL